MFSFFKKKKIVPHVRLTGIIGSAGKFKQGMELANQRDILKKAFSLKKITHSSTDIIVLAVRFQSYILLFSSSFLCPSRKNLIRNLDGKTPPGDDFTYLCSNCHQAHPNKRQGLVKFDSVSVGVTGDKQLFIRRRLRASHVFAE